MIFAAGLGTRLQPLTQSTPKALIPLNGIPLLEIQIKKLIELGITDIIVNVHHFAEQVVQFLDRNKNFGANIIVSDESDQLLETGGGIKKASWFFEGESDFLVHNVDVITNIDFKAMIAYHRQQNTLATLAVRNRQSGRYLLFDNENVLCGWQNVKTGETIMSRESLETRQLAFSGIHLISTGIFSKLKQEGKFSIIKTYLGLAADHPVKGYIHDDSYWFDVGTPEQLVDAENFLKD